MNNLFFDEIKLINQIQMNVFCLQCTTGHGGSVERIDPEGVEWVDWWMSLLPGSFTPWMSHNKTCLARHNFIWNK